MAQAATNFQHLPAPEWPLINYRQGVHMIQIVVRVKRLLNKVRPIKARVRPLMDHINVILKMSGLGREGIKFALQEMTEPKVVCFNL